MARRPRIPAHLRQRITALDNHRYAYCRSPLVVGVPMVVEHIVPLVAGGLSTIENPCLSCYRCNEFKGRQAANDPLDGQVISLFHPQVQRWSEHFAWANDAVALVGLTASGRATVELLKLNSDWIVQARRIWLLIGLQPPLE